MSAMSKQEQNVATNRPRPPYSTIRARPNTAREPQIMTSRATARGTLPSGSIEKTDPNANQPTISSGNIETSCNRHTTGRRSPRHDKNQQNKTVGSTKNLIKPKTCIILSSPESKTAWIPVVMANTSMAAPTNAGKMRLRGDRYWGALLLPIFLDECSAASTPR